MAFKYPYLAPFLQKLLHFRVRNMSRAALHARVAECNYTKKIMWFAARLCPRASQNHRQGGHSEANECKTCRQCGTDAQRWGLKPLTRR